jgi:hypothetical protein
MGQRTGLGAGYPVDSRPLALHNKQPLAEAIAQDEAMAEFRKAIELDPKLADKRVRSPL